ncbi:MAG: hypothetical protein JW932_17850 [Deltaproteobacteria bacterium]|nr:hypothetical protein [Deltaproteobacteria bacterium]
MKLQRNLRSSALCYGPFMSFPDLTGESIIYTGFWTPAAVYPVLDKGSG